MDADLAAAHQKRIGDHKGDDSKGFLAEMPSLAVTPYIAKNTN